MALVQFSLHKALLNVILRFHKNKQDQFRSLNIPGFPSRISRKLAVKYSKRFLPAKFKVLPTTEGYIDTVATAYARNDPDLKEIWNSNKVIEEPKEVIEQFRQEAEAEQAELAQQSQQETPSPTPSHGGASAPASLPHQAPFPPQQPPQPPASPPQPQPSQPPTPTTPTPSSPPAPSPIPRAPINIRQNLGSFFQRSSNLLSKIPLNKINTVPFKKILSKPALWTGGAGAVMGGIVGSWGGAAIGGLGGAFFSNRILGFMGILRGSSGSSRTFRMPLRNMFSWRPNINLGRIFSGRGRLLGNGGRFFGRFRRFGPTRTIADKRLALLFIGLLFLIIFGAMLLNLFGGGVPGQNLSSSKQLAISKTGPGGVDGAVANGQPIVYTINVGYLGQGIANIEVTDIIPDNAVPVSASEGKVIGKVVTWQFSLSSGQTKQLALVVAPLDDNIWVVNSADAKITSTSGAGTIPTTGNVPANNDTCSGRYKLNNPLGQNYGDPQCNFTKDDLYTLIEQNDPTNAYFWFNVIIPCESSYNPNDFFSGSPDPQGAWGLYQMGRGRNGQYDHGDVVWTLQTTNAINYNNFLATKGRTWGYWACAQDKYRR